jgi:hypothetical protein
MAKRKPKYQISSMLKHGSASVGLHTCSGKALIVDKLREKYQYPGGMDKVLELHTEYLISHEGLELTPQPLKNPSPRPERTHGYVTGRTDLSLGDSRPAHILPWE